MRNFLLFIFVLTCYFLNAQEPVKKAHPIDEAYQKCLDKKENQHTQGMIKCANDAKNAWTAEMNKYYQLLQKRITADQKAKLKATQDTWEKYKQQEFGLSADLLYGKGGTLWHFVAADSETEFVKQRTLRLKSYYEALSEENP